LSGVDFTDANLTGAGFMNAKLSGAHWSNTTCPDGINSDKKVSKACY